MNSVVRLTLRNTPAQEQRLAALQQAFAQVCNALAPMVQQTRCWNRVALHHMAYKPLRQRFPELGSQMICNAIYSVSRTCRIVYQHPGSPFNLARLGDRGLPRVQFLPQSPVYFDRHTLSLKDGQASMFTLDGRMKFQLDLTPEHEERFRHEKLREIVLDRAGGRFRLSFQFAGQADDADAPAQAEDATAGTELPQYVVVTDEPPLPMPPGLAAPANFLPSHAS